MDKIEGFFYALPMRIDVAFKDHENAGWSPIIWLGRLAARLFGGNVVALSPERPNLLKRTVNLRPRKRGGEDAGLLAILRSPGEFALLRATPEFRRDYRFVAVWIIDSFWNEWVPNRRNFADIDLLAVTRPNDIDRYAAIMGHDRMAWLGWGSDVLSLGGAGTSRPVDVTRIGRQPPQWDDDAESAAACHAEGLIFAGRPPTSADAMTSHRNVFDALARTKFVIAHSNLASPAPYTHPTEEYLTGRWADSLACGAIVAGMHPRSDQSLSQLLWPGALLDFDRIDLRHNVAALAEAAAAWSPADVLRNHRESLLRLDWRWRLEQIAQAMSAPAPILQQELALIRQQVAAA